MLSRMDPRNLLVAAFAGGGVLTAHELGYRWATYGGDGHQHEVLTQSGHGYFLYLIVAVATITVALLWRYMVYRLEERRGPDVSGVQLCAQTAVRLIPLQGIAFLLLESVERGVASGGVTNVLVESSVLMGLFFQVVVATAGGVLASAFAGVVEVLRRRTWSLAARRPMIRVYPKAHAFGGNPGSRI